jgi:hypothetical protein
MRTTRSKSGEHQGVEEFRAESRDRGVETLPEWVLQLIGTHCRGRIAGA